MSWPMVSLSRVATINPRCPKDIDENQLVSFVAMASASEEGILLQEEIRVLGETKKGFTYFEKEDVLLAKITPCFENGKSLRPFQISKQVGFGSTEFHVVRADEKKLLPQYLFYLLWSNAFRFAGEHAMSGAAGQKRVGTDFLKNFEIPLPPLDEQKRIAAILDKADAIRQKRKQAITLADEFLRSVFLEMFGTDLVRDKNRVQFGDVTILDAKMVDPREDEYLDLLHIGPDRIQKNTGKLLPALTAKEEGLISKKFFFNSEYVLYSKIRPYLRKAAIPDFSALCSADMYPVKPIEGKATREFIWMLLLSDLFDTYVASLPDRANIPKLNKKELAAFEFSLPDYRKITKFSQIVKQHNKSLYSMELAVQIDETSFNALSQKAFSGQL
ncbi:restriction endonuclease subunit S [Vibrio cholerae]|nr:restriction endonuclease subunit S [Vibrio cholerae]